MSAIRSSSKLRCENAGSAVIDCSMPHAAEPVPAAEPSDGSGLGAKP